MRCQTLVLTLGLLLTSVAQAQWTEDTPVVLKGKIVSMDTRVRTGQVVIRNGKIEAILSASATPPAGAIVIDTKGYIYPGLINLHNHLKYNFTGLYDVPKASANHDQWPSGKDYQRYVNNPTALVTGSNFYARQDEALKYAEVRAIVGGETAIQGAQNSPAISRTLVRNVELKNFGEDTIGQRALTIDSLFWRHKEDVMPSIKRQRAWLFHLCEGIDDYSRKEWSDSGWDPTKPFSSSKSARNRPGVVEADLVFPGLVGIHCTAMEREDFKQWKAITGGVPKIVWSPTSNLMLYGATTDIRAAKLEGALISLGTDWAPTGTKNLLWELKVADAYNRKQSPRLFRGDKALVELVTTNPAKILGWEDRVGKIKVGYYADLIVVDNIYSRSGYKNLVMAHEVNIQLVMVGGNPLYGDEAHLEKLKVYNGQKQYERLPGSSDTRPKVIDMLQDLSARKGDMTLAEVIKNLEEGLDLDTAVLAKILNDGKRISSTKVSYKARDYVRANLKKKLERAQMPVPASLDDPDSDLTPAQLETYIELKYPNLRKIDGLPSFYTDPLFLDRLEKNLFWKDLGFDLRKYLPPEIAVLKGMNAALSQDD
ncbi:MAG: amidohydrolase family protein [Planctomycetes bacterium]|nr:amidohydrolase family protein [Planctomycetota bacterium]